MSKIPNDVTLVRLDKESYNKFKDFCDERGLIAPKQIGFLLEGILKNSMNFELIKAGWLIVEEKIREKEKHLMYSDKTIKPKDTDCVKPVVKGEQ